MQLYLLLVFLVLTLSISACAKRQRQSSLYLKPTQDVSSSASELKRININTASASELETLPGIGKALAARILEHREQFGPFRRTAHLIIVRGISDKRFRALQPYIAVE